MSDPNPMNKGYFVEEIQMMMHGFGDCSQPLVESAKLIEIILKQQMKLLLHQAEDVAAMHNSKIIGPQELVFLMRKDKVKLKRLLNYLALKDLKEVLWKVKPKSNELEVEELFPLMTGPTKTKRVQVCLDFLHSIGVEVKMDDDLEDQVKLERNLRANTLSLHLTPGNYTHEAILDQLMKELFKRQAAIGQSALKWLLHQPTAAVSIQGKYKDYSKAKTISFTRSKLKAKNLFEWLEWPNKKINGIAKDIIEYLAKETVACIIDLVFLIRKDVSTPQLVNEFVVTLQ